MFNTRMLSCSPDNAFNCSIFQGANGFQQAMKQLCMFQKKQLSDNVLR